MGLWAGQIGRFAGLLGLGLSINAFAGEPRQCPFQLITPGQDPVGALRSYFSQDLPEAALPQSVRRVREGQGGYLLSFNPAAAVGRPSISAPDMRRRLLDALHQPDRELGLQKLNSADLAQMNAIVRSDPRLRERFNPLVLPNPTRPQQWQLTRPDERQAVEFTPADKPAEASPFALPTADAAIRKILDKLIDIKGLAVPKEDWGQPPLPLAPPSGRPIREALLPGGVDIKTRAARCLDPIPPAKSSAALQARIAIARDGNGPSILQTAMFDGIKRKLKTGDLSADSIAFLNMIANYDHCCFERVDPQASALLKTAYENTGAVLRRDSNNGYYAIATATVIEPGILLTARHALFDGKQRIADSELFFSPNMQPEFRIALRSDIDLNGQPYDQDSANDYALLMAPDFKAAPGVPMRRRPPALHEDLMILGFTMHIYELEGAAIWASGIVDARQPPWHAAMRLDAGGQCKVATTIQKPGKPPQRCFVHGCQAEAGSSGAPLFVIETEGGQPALKIAGIHLGGANVDGNACSPDRAAGNMGTSIPDSISADIAAGRRLIQQLATTR